MIEKYIYEGSCLSWLPYCSEAPTPVANQNLNVMQLLAGGFCSQNIIHLQNNCLFLPYVQGYINYVCTAVPKDVFSFPFSGCYMAHFLMNNLHFYVHVSTPECNAIWDLFKQNNRNIQNLIEFKPNINLHNNMTQMVHKIYGLITSEMNKYSIVVCQMPTPNPNPNPRICLYRGANPIMCNLCPPTMFCVVQKIQHL